MKQILLFFIFKDVNLQVLTIFRKLRFFLDCFIFFSFSFSKCLFFFYGQTSLQYNKIHRGARSFGGEVLEFNEEECWRVRS